MGLAIAESSITGVVHLTGTPDAQESEATKEEFMRYVVRYSGPKSANRDVARQLTELRAARRELQAARREVRNRA